MILNRECFLNFKWSLLAVLIATSFSIPACAVVTSPAVVSSCGYINPTPLTEHTTHAFNSKGATTLVAYLSSHPVWNGKRVSFEGVTDSTGNNWKLLAGPTAWDGKTFTLMSAIYYVNAPITEAAHSLTVHLTNPSPLVVHVFAVSGTDITAPPIVSPIVSLLDSKSSNDVLGRSINVPADTLLLGWAKNETNATATAVDGYTLDSQSTTFLWGESEITDTDGAYTPHFHYNIPIGWQTAIVGMRKMQTPIASSQAVTTVSHTLVPITLSALSPKRSPLTWKLLSGPTHGALRGVPPSVTYLPDADYVGPDSFKFKVLEGTAESNVASINITVHGKTFIQRLRENTMKMDFFSIIWESAIAAMLPSKKS